MSESSPEPELIWQEEAQAVVQDVKDLVKEISVASSLSGEEQVIHLNLMTLENNKYCIELSNMGFRVVGNNFNDITSEEGRWFDTPYSLLASLSPQYNSRFAESLITKLEQLPKEG